jgi:hypothetical protein
MFLDGNAYTCRGSLNGPVTKPQGITDVWQTSWMFKHNKIYHPAYAAASISLGRPPSGPTGCGTWCTLARAPPRGGNFAAQLTETA